MSTLHIFKESLILTIHTCRDISDGFSVEKPTLGGHYRNSMQKGGKDERDWMGKRWMTNGPTLHAMNTRGREGHEKRPSRVWF